MELTAPATGEQPHRHVSNYSTGYSIYVLFILFAANMLNYADRSILSALAESIKRDLHISDAQIGFLYGTSIIVLNAIAGLAMGALVDGWLRNRLLMIGVGLWSILTAGSGLAVSFIQLAVARFGIGLCEATCGPVCYALVGDIFPPHQRGKAFAVFFCGPWLGTALGISVSGWIVQNWPHVCGGIGLCDRLAGWQAAFLAFGIPGIVIAILAGFVREPAQGADAERRRHGRPLVDGGIALGSLIPPFSVINLWRLGGRSAVIVNIQIVAIILAAAALLIALTGDYAQWLAVTTAAYALASWCQALRYRDPDLYRLTVASPAFRAVVAGVSLIGTTIGALGFWSIPLAVRSLGMTTAEAGAMLGPAIGLASIVGALLGGFAVDRWKRTNPAAALWIGIIAFISAFVFFAVLLMMKQPLFYAFALFALMVAGTSWGVALAGLQQELVLPSMRGRGAALYIVTVSLIGLSAGPYLVGRVSDFSGSLRIGMLASFFTLPFAIGSFLFAKARLSAAFQERDRLAAKLLS